MSNQTETPATVRLPGRQQDVSFQVEIDGETVAAYAGDRVATVLMASGNRIFGHPSRYNLARTLFCGIGLCHQCLVTVDRVQNVRACMTKVHPGMKIETFIAEK